MNEKSTDHRKSAADDISVGNIGQGSLYSKGSFGGKSGDRGWGLKGQLFNYKKEALNQVKLKIYRKEILLIWKN